MRAPGIVPLKVRAWISVPDPFTTFFTSRATISTSTINGPPVEVCSCSGTDGGWARSCLMRGRPPISSSEKSAVPARAWLRAPRLPSGRLIRGRWKWLLRQPWRNGIQALCRRLSKPQRWHAVRSSTTHPHPRVLVMRPRAAPSSRLCSQTRSEEGPVWRRAWRIARLSLCFVPARAWPGLIPLELRCNR